MRRLSNYFSFYRKEAILCPFFKLIEAIFELFVPLIVRQVIDVGIPAQDLSYIYRMGALLLLLGAVGLCLALIGQYLASKASQGIGTRLRNELFEHIGNLSHAQLEQFGTASLVNRLTNDINQLQLAIAMLLRVVIRVVFLIVGASVMALFIDVHMFLIFLATGLIVSCILFVVIKKSLPLYRNIQQKLDQIGLITMENLEGVRVIRAFSREQTEIDRFATANDSHKRTAFGAFQLTALLTPLTSVVMNLAIIAILWIGSGQVNSGAMAQGDVVALVNYVTQILLALVVLAGLVILFTKASASAQRIYAVLDLIPQINLDDSRPVSLVTEADVPLVEFRDVSFSYSHGDEEEPALSNLSFTVFSGQTVGIIGATGSGKSTLMHLIPRFYDVTSGTVLLAGVDVRTLAPTGLREQIGFVSQNPMLFHGSIEKNLRISKKDATQQELLQALQVAQAADFVAEIPDGLQATISQNATNLSGGQKQRLHIARALTRSPELLLLDDSFSALDFATELRLRRSIRAESATRTIFIVSQRINAVRDADLILVMHEGILVSQGTHQKLSQSCEIYQAICISQQTDLCVSTK